jgi:hypothetical protein
LFVHSEDWITLSTLVHIIPSSITLTHGLVIGVVMAIDDWPMYNGSIIRPDPTKINKGRRRKIRIPMVMDEMEGRINMMPTRGRARSSRA